MRMIDEMVETYLIDDYTSDDQESLEYFNSLERLVYMNDTERFRDTKLLNNVDTRLITFID